MPPLILDVKMSSISNGRWCDHRRMRFAIAVLFLAAAAPAAAQQPAPTSQASVFVTASAGITRFSLPTQSPNCAPSGNRGLFCGGASGFTPSIAGQAGAFATRYLGFAVEGSLTKTRSGSATYDQQSHTDYNVTSASFDHSTERGISGLVFGHIRVGTRGTAIEPAAGWTLVHATDRLTDQVRVAGAAGFPRVTSHPADADAQYSAKGFTFGMNVTTRPVGHVSFVGSVRARWLNWPQVLTSTYYAFRSPNTTQFVPVSVGRWSLVFNAGLRLSSNK